MKTVLAVGALTAAVASAASADVTYTLVNQQFLPLTFMEASTAGSLDGILTGASINIVLNASGSGAYADDLTVYVAGSPLALGGALQCGGYMDLNADQRYFWPNGGSSVPGTPSIGTVVFTTGLNMTGSTNSIWIGNGYGEIGIWSGTITLHGVNVIPAPGAIALLGLVGLARRRRR